MPCSVQSVLDEMQAVLDDSGRSMRELSTDTKEQQREWWRARCAAAARVGLGGAHVPLPRVSRSSATAVQGC